MKKLTLFRHAKSEWSDREMRDFDRPLNERGYAGARVMGQYLGDHGYVFDAVLASPAVRVTETIDHAVKTYARDIVPEWDRRIYLASSVTLMDVLRGVDNSVNHVLMVGHNPGLEDLIFDLVPDNGDALRDEVELKFPTASLADVEIDIDDWDDIDDGKGRITGFVRPRDLDPALGPARF